MSIHHRHPFPTSTHHFQAFPINFPRCPKMLQESSILLQEAKLHREKNCFYHISKTVHPLVDLFHGERHMDDDNMLNEFQQIPMHTFRKIVLHHLQLF